MNIPPLAELFIPILKQNKLISEREEDNNYRLIMLSLFKDLLEAEKYINKCHINSKFTVDTSINKKDIPNNSRYFPKSIRDYISNTTCSLFNFNCNLNGRENNINFYVYSNENRSNENILKDLSKKVKFMLIWLYICNKYANKKCAEDMTINIYLTPFTKTLPENNTTVLSAEHVNTAYTYACTPEGEIIIYREEEWFKVFLHESFHTYGLDFALSDSTTLRKLMERTFHIKSEFNSNEAYTETWARIINCALFSFFSMKDKKDSETFLLYTDFCLQLERIFSLYQMNKILNFMGLNYKDLYNKSSAYLKQHLYKENTHVFGYYILTAVFLNNYKGFIQWCWTNNVSKNNVASVKEGSGNSDMSFMKFNCNEESLKKIGEYINSMYDNDSLLKIMDYFNNNQFMVKKNDVKKTTRMTIITL